jgi:hypothetical protein
MLKFANAEFRALLRAVSLALPLALLGACSATDQKVSSFFNKADDRPDDIPASYFSAPAYCPTVRVRAGTETFIVYERGHDGEPQFIQYQGSITKTARECAKTADGFTVKVGIAGRAVAGPKGGPGTVTLPLRVALTQQSEGVEFSKLYKIQVTIEPSSLGGEFTQVVEAIPVVATPDEKDFVVYVGFDEGKTG